jgi:predicted DNA-binding transcriptional regulator AlpA
MTRNRQQHDEKRYLSKPTLAGRYSVSTRSIDRWVELGRFPRPDMRLPNGRPMWSDDTIEAHERALVGKTA